jgi:deazaflavin-dependent oxidoreductase (nitroreductase family)
MEKDFPRKSSALYGIIIGNDETTKRTLSKWKKYNKVFVVLYEIGLLPLLGVGWFILLLYTKGRRTGKTRVTPLEYRKREGSMILFSARGSRSDWYRNMVKNPDKVEIRVGFKTHNPKVEIIGGNEVIEDYLKWYIQKHPRSSRLIFGWDPKIDNLHTTDLTSLINMIKIVKLSVRMGNKG